MRFFLVQAILKSKYGESKARPRIVAAKDQICAARTCFDELPPSSKNDKKFPDRFKVWAQRTPESFIEDVGSIVLDFEENTCDTVEDLFVANHEEVRL